MFFYNLLAFADKKVLRRCALLFESFSRCQKGTLILIEGQSALCFFSKPLVLVVIKIYGSIERIFSSPN